MSIQREVIRENTEGDAMANKKQKTEKFKLVTDENMSFAVKEAYNSLRTNLLYSLSPINGKVVAITSSNAGEGKSTVAINLALTMALTSSKVLLIDADLRRPSVHKKLGLDNSKGLSRFIVGFETMSDSLKREVFPCLDIMTAGPIPPNPSELLGSDNMKVFLQKASDYYDYIIIDSPPINIVTDVAVMADFISGVIYVARYGSTTTEDLKKSKLALEKVNAKLLGLVTAGVESKKSLYVKGKGSYYYYYTSKEDEE
ncbi:MAG: CpsD/CapB family tyrosine-protein kinase [Ruminococcaceae bacterium]|nr:CpsD/CapB family tyrosine-protein kinase [Oscillospiraceae bacterium]